MSKWSRDTLLTWILATVAGLLVVAVTVEWVMLDRNRQAVLGTLPSKTGSVPVQSEAEEEERGFELPELDTYEQVTERPLFAESRRPEVVAPSVELPPDQPKSPLTLKLMGIVFTPTTQTALLVDAKGKYKRVKLQETFDNWTLVELSPDWATLQQGEERQKLDLLKIKPKPPKPPGTPGQTGQAPPRPAMAGGPAQGRMPGPGRQVQRPQPMPEDMDTGEEDMPEDEEDMDSTDEEDVEDDSNTEEP